MGHVDTLIARWIDGSETYSRAGEALLLATAADGKVVGVGGLSTDVGFVPNDLVSRYNDLKSCNERFSAALSPGQSTIPDDACRALLIQQGVSPEMIDLRMHRPS
jgi:hypothetical protein